MVENVVFTGTIERIVAPEIDFVNQHTIQKIVICNVIANNNPINLPHRVLLIIRLLPSDRIPFVVNDPITVKGNFIRSSDDKELSFVIGARNPTGYISYGGKVYA